MEWREMKVDKGICQTCDQLPLVGISDRPRTGDGRILFWPVGQFLLPNECCIILHPHATLLVQSIDDVLGCCFTVGVTRSSGKALGLV